jgi:hypothetical protein
MGIDVNSAITLTLSPGEKAGLRQETDKYNFDLEAQSGLGNYSYEH